MKQIISDPQEKRFLYKSCPSCKTSFTYSYGDTYKGEAIYYGRGSLLYIECPKCYFPCRHAHSVPLEEPITSNEVPKENNLLKELEETNKKYMRNFSIINWFYLIFLIVMVMIVLLEIANHFFK